MYTIAKQNAKIVTRKWKEGLTQPLERLEKRTIEGQRETTQQLLMMSSPKAVFNGKNRNMHLNNNGRVTPESNQASHEENVLYLAEAWNKVETDLTMARRHNKEGPVYYQDKRAPSQAHRDFEPFDLEKWRENRLFERNMRRS